MAAVTGSIEERRFVVMRFKRIKTWTHVYHVRRHNTREMECPHLEADAPPPVLIVGTADVAGEIRHALKRYGVKHRPGEVLALEFVVSASREVFDGLEGEAYSKRLREFMMSSLRAFHDRFKIDGQIVSVALHEDERTPHLHVVVVPLICEPDNRRKDKAPIYRLSAKRVIGGRGDMSREQTRFASYFEHMGLERGKERSGARHVSNREHEAMLEQARQEVIAEREGLAMDRQKIAEVAMQLGNERDALAAERAAIQAERETVSENRARLDRDREALEADRLRLREERERLAAEREAMMKKCEEAEALKKRAIERTQILRDLLAAGENLRRHVLAMAPERRTPAIKKAVLMSKQLDEASREATQHDAWLATMIAHRGGTGGQVGR